MVTTDILLPALSRNGRADVAYQLLAEKTYPSWGYFLDQGATTMWEHWDSKTRAGFNPSTMNSFNHANLGACSEWFFETILGINPGEPGYGKIIIKPQPGGGVTWAKGHYDSIHGRIESAWKIAGQQFTLNVTIPANTSATIYVPGKDSSGWWRKIRRCKRKCIRLHRRFRRLSISMPPGKMTDLLLLGILARSGLCRRL